MTNYTCVCSPTMGEINIEKEERIHGCLTLNFKVRVEFEKTKPKFVTSHQIPTKFLSINIKIWGDQKKLRTSINICIRSNTNIVIFLLFFFGPDKPFCL